MVMRAWTVAATKTSCCCYLDEAVGNDLAITLAKLCSLLNCQACPGTRTCVCVRMILSEIRLVQGKALTFKSCPLLLGSSNSVSLAITSR